LLFSAALARGLLLLSGACAGGFEGPGLQSRSTPAFLLMIAPSDSDSVTADLTLIRVLTAATFGKDELEDGWMNGTGSRASCNCLLTEGRAIFWPAGVLLLSAALVNSESDAREEGLGEFALLDDGLGECTLLDETEVDPLTLDLPRDLDLLLDLDRLSLLRLLLEGDLSLLLEGDLSLLLDDLAEP
jgi:hypothetical protein